MNALTTASFKRIVGRLAAAFFSAAAIFVIVEARSVHGARNDTRATAKQTRPRVTTAAEANKNIKVLKDLPNAQLIPVMSSMSASLGVSCEFCHATKNGQLDAAAEGKDEKNTARDMIRMVKEINRRDFRGELQISCFTCHVGKPLPQKFPALPVAMLARSASNAQATPAASQSLPIGAEVIDNYLSAIGGKTALDRIESCVITGKYSTAAGPTGTFEIDQLPPDKGHESTTTPRGTRDRIVNGDHGWDKTVFGVSDLLPQQAPDLRLRLPLLLDLGLKTDYSELSVANKVQIDGRETYVVDATRKDERRETLYFDTESRLLLRRVTYTPTTVGIIPEQVDFSDYRDVEGVKFPFTVRVSVADSNNPSTTRTFEEVKINVPIDAARFEKPKS